MSAAVALTHQAPFLGLRYFDEEHSHLFFGREEQVHDILEKLRQSRLVSVIGSSGCGKSSLIRAGVIRSLQVGFLGEAGPRWRVAKIRPGSNAIANLTRGLEMALAGSGLEITLRRGPLGLIQAVEECRLPAGDNVLVVVDQFEELFRYQRESADPEGAKDEATAFVKLLLEATRQCAVPIYVIVTMRSDYLGNCAQFRDFPERLNEGLYLVPRMRRDQLEQAIRGPAAVEDAEISARLVQRLLNDTSDDPDQLPVLQHALLRAWNAWNHAPRPLDLEDLEAVGGMTDSLSRHADEIFNGLSAEQQRIARILFQQLSDRDAEGREIRRPAPVAHIAAVAGVGVPEVEQVVARFADPGAALLYRNEDGDLDITHESLIRKWRLVQGSRSPGAEAEGWLHDEIEARDHFLLLVDRARKSDALRGRALEDAARWQGRNLNAAWARRHTKPAEAERAIQDVRTFIAECLQRDLRARRLRMLSIGAALSAVAVFLTVIVVLWRTAEDRRAQLAVLNAQLEEANLTLNERAVRVASRYLQLRGQLASARLRVSGATVMVAREDVRDPAACHEPKCTMTVTASDGGFSLDLTRIQADIGDDLVLTAVSSGFQPYSRRFLLDVGVVDPFRAPVVLDPLAKP